MIRNNRRHDRYRIIHFQKPAHLSYMHMCQGESDMEISWIKYKFSNGNGSSSAACL